MDFNGLDISNMEPEDLMHFVEELESRDNEIRRKQLELFHKLKPDRCGKVDFEKNEVIYDDERYTEWHSNHGIEQLQELIKIYDLVGLDYELRVGDEMYDPSKVFSIKYVNTPEDNKKYWIALELHLLYIDFYEEKLNSVGIDLWDLCEKDKIDFHIAYTGCEKVAMPEKYSDDNPLLTDDEINQILKELYIKAKDKIEAPQPIFELEFEKVEVDGVEKKLCKAKMDENNLLSCREKGFDMLQIHIAPEKFVGKITEKIEDERKVYYMEFILEE